MSLSAFRDATIGGELIGFELIGGWKPPLRFRVQMLVDTGYSVHFGRELSGEFVTIHGRGGVGRNSVWSWAIPGGVADEVFCQNSLYVADVSRLPVRFDGLVE